jgi:hypothetical protein
MIGLGLRLAAGGGREAATRLMVTIVAVAVGVGMLLITLAGIGALRKQSERAAWLQTGAAQSGPVTGPLIWLTRTDYFDGQQIDRIDLAVVGPNAPVPPGIGHLPGPGQFYASPALTAMLHSDPPGELRDRFPGRQVGTIGQAALPAPDSLVIIVGHTPGQLGRAPGATTVTTIRAAAGGSTAPTAQRTGSLEAVLAIAALALLLPVMLFISTATRLAAARREQRFAAMRLVGATPRQITIISAVEACVAAGAGTAAGFALFFLVRSPVAGIPFAGQPFFPAEMTLSPADILGVAIGIPVLAALVARIALRQVQITPLGVSRRVSPEPPGWWRILPLAAGTAELAYFAAAGHPRTVAGQTGAFFLGFALIITGLITGGPWLTMAASWLLVRRARRPAVLIAGRRIGDNPRFAFRAVGGLIVALFVTSAITGVIGTLAADNGLPRDDGPAAADTVVDQFAGGSSTTSGQPIQPLADISAPVIARLHAISGVRGVTVIHGIVSAQTADAPANIEGLASCAQIATTPALGRCAGGATVGTMANLDDGTLTSVPGPMWPASRISIRHLDSLPATAVAVNTDGSAAAIERVRTVLETAVPYLGSAVTIAETQGQAQQQITQWQHDADVLILASLPIAGCSLAVSVAAGLTDRKIPFSLLRLTGVPLGLLRRVVAIETAVPLVIVAVASAGAGLLAADLFLRSQFGETMRSPGTAYYLSVLAGIILSLAIIACTLPLLGRITGPEAARTE